MRSAVFVNRGRTEAGITLVETLIALALGLVVLSAAFNLYVSNRTVYKQVQGVARLQESARVAATLLAADIRQAGGSLCRNGLPTTNIVNSSAWWAQPDKGIEGFGASETDDRAAAGSAYPRTAGDSFTVWSSNSGPAALVVATNVRGSIGGYPGSMDWKISLVDSSGFSKGDLVVICDYYRALIAQAVADSANLYIRKGVATTPSPGNCGGAFSASSTRIEALPSCGVSLIDYNAGRPPDIASDYTWDTGSMVGTLTAHHWYIGSKTSTTPGSLNNLALRRLTINYNRAGNGSIDATPTSEEMVENVTNMEVSYLLGDSAGYPPAIDYKSATEITNDADWAKVIAVRITLTLSSPDAIGVGATGAASATTYTFPVDAAIRARLPVKLTPFP